MNAPKGFGPIAQCKIFPTFLKLTSKYWIGIIPVVFYRLTNRVRTRRLWYDMVDSL